MLKSTTVCYFLLLATNLWADSDRVEVNEVNDLRIELVEEQVILNVSIQTLDRDKIEERQRGDTFEAWMGTEKLPVEVLWYKPTVIRSFSLQIDGKDITIPARFWNDLAGVSLHTVRLAVEEPTPEDLDRFANSLSQARLRPQVSRSAQGGTVLITWARPEE